MLIGPEKWHKENFLPETVKKLLSYGLGKPVGLYVFIFIDKGCERINFHDTSGNISQTLNIIDKNMKNIYKLIRMSFLYICYDIFPSVALHTT